MEIENKILRYLKSINVDAYNKHNERYIDNYVLSIVMISTVCKDEYEYTVSIVCFDKNNNKIYGNLLSKIFDNNTSANKYYDELNLKMTLINADAIKELISVI